MPLTRSLAFMIPPKWLAIVLFTAIAFLPCGGQAQTSDPGLGLGLPAADEKALREYQVSAATFRKLLAFKHDADRIRDEGEEDDDDKVSVPDSIDAMVGLLEKEPRARDLFDRHELTAREYVLAHFALLRAGMASAFAMTSPDQVEEAGTNPANMAFYRDNRAAVDDLFSGPDNETDDAANDAANDEADAGGTGPASDTVPASDPSPPTR